MLAQLAQLVETVKQRRGPAKALPPATVACQQQNLEYCSRTELELTVLRLAFCVRDTLGGASFFDRNETVTE